MKTFIMTADCMPKNARNWFRGFNEGMEFEAESLGLAQEWLDEQCAKAGTNDDAHFDEFGPVAIE